MNVRQPIFIITYNGKNITEDISSYVLSVRYTDHVIGKTDSIEISLDNTSQLWSGSWYPNKGDDIKMQIGYDDTLVDCGHFIIDEIALSGPPDVVEIRAMAAWVTTAMRTKKTYADDGQTLAQIAQRIAQNNNLKFNDGSKTTITNKSYNLKSEANSLNSLAIQLGSIYTYPVLTDKYNDLNNIISEIDLITNKVNSKGFTQFIKQLNANSAVLRSALSNLSNVDVNVQIRSILLNTSQTMAKLASLMSTETKTGTTIKKTPSDIYTLRFQRSTQFRETDLEYLKRITDEYGFVFNIRGDTMYIMSIFDIEDGLPVITIDKSDLKSWSLTDKTNEVYGSVNVSYHNPKTRKVLTYSEVAKSGDIKGEYIQDIKIVRSKIENEQQARLKAKASLHMSNSKQQYGSIELEGYPLLVAGNNIILTGLGPILSGKYHIEQSEHDNSRGAGYITKCNIKRVGRLEAEAIKKEVKKTPPNYKVTKI